MNSHRTLNATCLAVLVIVLLSGCANERAVPPTPSGQPETTHRISGYDNHLPPQAAKDRAVLVVQGTVVGIGTPTWNTADRRKPSTEPQGDELPAIIYTPFRIKVDRRYKGVIGQFLDVKSFGGTVGADTYMFDPGTYVPAVGEHMVIYVSQIFTEKNGDKLAIPLSVYSIVDTAAVNQFGGDQSRISASELKP